MCIDSQRTPLVRTWQVKGKRWAMRRRVSDGDIGKSSDVVDVILLCLIVSWLWTFRSSNRLKRRTTTIVCLRSIVFFVKKARFRLVLLYCSGVQLRNSTVSWLISIRYIGQWTCTLTFNFVGLSANITNVLIKWCTSEALGASPQHRNKVIVVVPFS